MMGEGGGRDGERERTETKRENIACGAVTVCVREETEGQGRANRKTSRDEGAEREEERK